MWKFDDMKKTLDILPLDLMKSVYHPPKNVSTDWQIKGAADIKPFDSMSKLIWEFFSVSINVKII